MLKCYIGYFSHTLRLNNLRGNKVLADSDTLITQ